MNPTQKEISIIVPVYNKAALTFKCLSLNLAHCANPQHWIIIDNNSDEETKTVLLDFKQKAESLGHRVHIETELTNTGVARAWNKGLSISKTHYQLILNNDCVMQPGWDEALIAEDNKGVLQLFSPLVFEPNYFKQEFSLEKFLLNDKWKELQQKNNNRYYKGFFSGIVFFGSKAIFEKIGKYDEQFWLSMEDIDFQQRARMASIKIGLAGSITAFHFVSATRKTVQMDEQSNREKFMLKWGWDYVAKENTFINKRKRSFRKWLMKNFELISQWPEKYPL